MLLVTRAAALQIIGTKESFSKQKGSTPTGLIWDTNLASISLFWDTNMVEVTSMIHADFIEVYFIYKVAVRWGHRQ